MKRIVALVAASVVGAAGGGGCGDAPGDPPGDGPGDQPSVAALRSALAIDLSTVQAFVSLGARNRAAAQARLPADDPSGFALFAVTLSGETLRVELTEPGQDGAAHTPYVAEVFPTTTWVLFSTPDLVVRDPGDPSTPLACRMVAARRADGALFCGPLSFHEGSLGPPGTIYQSVHASAAGDLVHFAVHDPENPQSAIIYRLELGGERPTAAAVTPSTIRPHWFLGNAAGDLYVNFYPSLVDLTRTRSQIYPAAGGAAVLLADVHIGFAAPGVRGSVDEDVFYSTVGGGGGQAFTGMLRAIVPDGSGGFGETTHALTLPEVMSYGGLYPLSDGMYMYAHHNDVGPAPRLARVIANGEVITAPTPVPLTGIDEVLGVDGESVHLAGDQAVFLARRGAAYVFVRHDGTTQVDVPLPEDLELLRVSFARSGAVDFFAYRIGTDERLRGEIAPGATEAVIQPAGELDPQAVVAFTRIN